jgi:predicted AAA+ superfamily ATPase
LGSLFSYNKLKEALHLGSANTVGSYTEFFEDSYLFFTLSRFSYSLRQQYAAPKKIYGVDTGLAECMAFQFSKNRGHFLENVAYLELRRRHSQLYYYQTTTGQEVDFLWRQGRDPAGLIQVTTSLQNPDVRAREVGALGQAMQELRLKQGLILTEDGEETLRVAAGTIHVRPLAQWLSLLHGGD